MVRAPSTTRAYASDWRDFAAWCVARAVPSLPATPATVVAYVDDVTERHRFATVRRRVAAVRAHHVDRDLVPPTTDPEVQAALTRSEWRRRHDDGRATRPLGVDELREVSRAAPGTIAGLRDRSLLLLGYGGGLAPGELTALAVADVAVAAHGVVVPTRGGRVLVPFGSDRWLCAVRAWQCWRRASGVQDGPAFRAIDRHGRVHDEPLGVRGVTRIVQRAVARAGLEPARYSGRSLRRGMVLAATEHGVSASRIMAHTGHRSRRLVRRYMSEDRPEATSVGSR
ncbi:MAG: tyrosine-type recombinase/integrase [Acidimicrobiia bacterium]